MDDIKKLSEQFRYAIDSALRAGEFKDDFSFHRFPSGCCGDTCILLAQFLLEYGIRTYYVCGFKKSWSHAWLCTDNDIIMNYHYLHNCLEVVVSFLLNNWQFNGFKILPLRCKQLLRS